MWVRVAAGRTRRLGLALLLGWGLDGGGGVEEVEVEVESEVESALKEAGKMRGGRAV